jgi:Zn-dependent protease
VRDRFAPGTSSTLTGGGNEALEFGKAWAATSLAFAIFIQPDHFIFEVSFFSNLLIAALTCGIGFVIHELAHRVIARGYGTDAHFVASNNAMLFIPILVAFAGIFIAAPGAVWHQPLSPKKTGLIALGGPVSNLVLAALFFGLTFFLPIIGVFGFWLRLATFGFIINAFLGLFNMIPVDPFDGGKVWRWNKVVFGVTAGIALIMVFVL